jgi:hypothetical protein
MMGVACSTHVEMRNAYSILIGRDHFEERRWEDNITMDLGEIERESVNWIRLAQDRDLWRALVNIVMNLRVPKKVGLFSFLGGLCSMKLVV